MEILLDNLVTQWSTFGIAAEHEGTQMYDYRLLFPRLAEQELRQENASRGAQDRRRVEAVRREQRARKERG